MACKIMSQEIHLQDQENDKILATLVSYSENIQWYHGINKTIIMKTEIYEFYSI